MNLALLKPVYALADSRLLFPSSAGARFPQEIAGVAGVERPSVAYLGASNCDNREFYEGIFLPAIEQFDAGEHRMIPSDPKPDDMEFLRRADIILLAGGSVEVGWRVFETNGVKLLIQQRYASGVVLIGVSAGAIQLGRGGLNDKGTEIVSTFGFVPVYFGAHDDDCWGSLRKTLALASAGSRGIGLPSGGGVRWQVGELEALCGPVRDICFSGACFERNIFPPSADRGTTDLP